MEASSGSPGWKSNIVPLHTLTKLLLQSTVVLTFIKGGAHTCCVDMSGIHASTQRIQAPKFFATAP